MTIGTTIGGFALIHELGRGGMGIVYEAEQTSPRRHVALKVLPPEFAHSPGVAARFKEEANRMAMLDGHPHIATVYAAGEESGTAYFAMQLLTGGDLEQRLQAGPMDQQQAAEIAAKVADALDFAHQRGIVHRDIKPANIMFSAQGEPVVTDFGIAKAADEVRMTLTGMSVCTPEYASPEQVKGNPIDGRSDLYSLGVMLYRMVCGRPLFDCQNPMTWAMKHISESPQPPGVWCPELNGQLQHVVLRCLAKEPSDRFSNGADVARALRGIDWVANTVVVAQPVIVRHSVRKPARRPYAIGGIGFAALTVGIALMVGHPFHRMVTVPGVLGMTAELATTNLAGAGLTVRQDGQSYSESYPEGNVCNQSPAPGAQAQKGAAVAILVSKGKAPPVKVPVPSVVGMTTAEAESKLSGAGLPIQSGELRYSDLPAGQICSQFPVSGTPVAPGDTVRVVTSKGPKPTPPPLPPDTAGIISGAIANWVNQWEHGTAASYVLGCYAPDADIYANGRHYTRPGFYENEQTKIGQPGVTIAVTHGPISMAWADDGDGLVRATFHLDYSRVGGPGGAHSSSGTQVLDFRLNNGQWLIVRDEFH